MTDAAASAAPGTCRQCGAVLAGPYCQACGQPSSAVRRSFSDAIFGQTGRFVRTLVLLVVRPGELAREIDEARDRRSTRPGSLLTNVIAFFFLVGGGLGGFSAHALIDADTTGTLARLTARQAETRGVQPAVYDERLDNRFRSTYSILIALSALSYGLALWLVERRKGKAWLVHLAAAVQYMCFTFVLSALAFGGARLLQVDLLARWWTGPLLIIPLAVYLYLMLRRVYDDVPGMAVLKMLFVLGVGFVSDELLGYAALGLALVTA
jgi:hypothetical protein